MNLVFIKVMCDIAHFGEVPKTCANNSQAVSEAIERALVQKYAYPEEKAPHRLRVTPKGAAYVEALQAVKEPMQSWTVPQ